MEVIELLRLYLLSDLLKRRDRGMLDVPYDFAIHAIAHTNPISEVVSLRSEAAIQMAIQVYGPLAMDAIMTLIDRVEGGEPCTVDLLHKCCEQRLGRLPWLIHFGV